MPSRFPSPEAADAMTAWRDVSAGLWVGESRSDVPGRRRLAGLVDRDAAGRDLEPAPLIPEPSRDALVPSLATVVT